MNATPDVTPDAVTLEITRLFDAPPARVFDAWLNRNAGSRRHTWRK